MQVVYFVTESGRRPVQEFVESLSVHAKRKFVYTVELLESFGRGLTFPHVKYIGDEIFELRFKGSEGAVRVLYFFFDGKTAVLTNGFLKKTNKIPKNEKETAKTRREIYLQRHKGGAR